MFNTICERHVYDSNHSYKWMWVQLIKLSKNICILKTRSIFLGVYLEYHVLQLVLKPLWCAVMLLLSNILYFYYNFLQHRYNRHTEICVMEVTSKAIAKCIFKRKKIPIRKKGNIWISPSHHAPSLWLSLG